MAVDPKAAFPFMDLPTEIRLNVYSKLSEDTGGHMNIIAEDNIYNATALLNQDGECPPESPTSSPAILRVSKQIHDEAKEAFFRNLKLDVRVNDSELVAQLQHEDPTVDFTEKCPLIGKIEECSYLRYARQLHLSIDWFDQCISGKRISAHAKTHEHVATRMSGKIRIGLD